MRVDLKTYGLGPPDENKTGRAGQPPAAERATDSAAPDQARFSFDQTRVRALEGQVLAQPEVRQQKVELLRQALGKGEYAVSDGQVAEALLADLAAGSAGQLAG
jgi:flagellar biosynthesis anti-sigma factor FlgM